ncbi:unnamed protein product, partial [Ectocarpus sp. 8 AP-2014]
MRKRASLVPRRTSTFVGQPSAPSTRHKHSLRMHTNIPCPRIPIIPSCILVGRAVGVRVSACRVLVCLRAAVCQDHYRMTRAGEKKPLRKKNKILTPSTFFLSPPS